MNHGRDLLTRVAYLAHNLWWSWNSETQRLFVSIDPALWKATGHNPIKMLRLLDDDRRERLLRDERLAEHVTRCEEQLKQYLQTRTWFDRTRRQKRDVQVAYFCAEFAIHECLPQILRRAGRARG